MFGETGYIIGQILSGVAVILGFIAYQMKTAKAILFVEIFTASVFSMHYMLIGAPTAMALNLLAVVQCVAYYIREKKGSKNKVVPIIFTVIIIITSILTWEGWHSLLIMIGLVAYSIVFMFGNAQMVRFAMFIKSPMCLAYNAIVLSIGGIFYESSVLISSVVGTVKYFKNKKLDKAKEESNGKI